MLRVLAQPDTVTVLLVDAAGAPLTALVAADVALYYRKDGGPATEKTLDGTNFREVDAANMPGVYEVDFTADELDERGEFVFVITEVGGSGVAQYTDTFQVGEPVPPESEVYGLDIAQNSERTFLVELESDGIPTTGATLEDIAVDTYLNGATVANTLPTSLTELSRGLYTLTLPSTLTATPGELVTVVRKPDDIAEGASFSGYPGTDATDIYAVKPTGNDVIVIVTDDNIFTAVDNVYISRDRSGTYEQLTFNQNGGATVRSTGVDGDETDADKFVICGYEPAGTQAAVYYTTDGGETFTETFHSGPQTVDTVRKISVANGDSSYFLLAQATTTSYVFKGSFFGGTFSTVATLANTTLYDVSSFQFNRVVVVGAIAGAGEIRFATDGNTFNSPTTLPAVAELRGVDMVRGGLAGFACGLSGTVLYTTDGGDNWVDQTGSTGTVEDLYAVYTLDANTAYVVGDNGTVIYTDDAGTSWSTPTPLVGFTALNLHSTYYADQALFAQADGEGVVYEEGKTFAQIDETRFRFQIPATDTAPALLSTLQATLDAELSRQRPAYGIPQSTAHTIAVYLATQGQANTGISGSAVTSLLFKAGTSTANTINTTLTELNGVTLPGWYSLTLSASDTDTLGDLVVDLRGGGLAVTFAGEQADPGGVADAGASVYAQSSLRAFIARANGLQGASVITTSDGGDTWVDTGGVTFEDTAVSGIEGTDFVIVGGADSGAPVVAYSDNDGGSYTQATENTFTVFSPVEDLDAASDRIVYIIAAGYVLKLDRDANPTSLAVSYSPGDVGGGGELFYGIAAVTTDVAVAVGEDGASQDFIIRTDDGGASWSLITLAGTPGTLRDIDFVDGTQVGWAVGNGGIIFYTADGGQSFTAQTSGVVADLFSVVAVSSDVAWVAGDNTILYTEDGGDTWQTDSTVQTALSGVIGTPVFNSGDEADGTLWFTGQTSGDVLIFQIQAASANLDPVSLRFNVDTPVDLAPITSSLADIQGAGFATGTDSLEALRDTIDTNNTTQAATLAAQDATLTAIQGAGFDTGTDSLAVQSTTLQDIQGATFSSGTDSLEALRDAIDGQSADITAIEGEVTAQTVQITQLQADLDDITTTLARILGLSQENLRISGHTYDASGNLTAATIRIYPTAQDVVDETNVIAAYALVASYDVSGRLIDYQFRRA